MSKEVFVISGRGNGKSARTMIEKFNRDVRSILVKFDMDVREMSSEFKEIKGVRTYYTDTCICFEFMMRDTLGRYGRNDKFDIRDICAMDEDVLRKMINVLKDDLMLTIKKRHLEIELEAAKNKHDRTGQLSIGEEPSKYILLRKICMMYEEGE